MLAMPVADETDGKFMPKKLLVLDGIELPLGARLPVAVPVLTPRPKRPVVELEGVKDPVEAAAV